MVKRKRGQHITAKIRVPRNLDLTHSHKVQKWLQNAHPSAIGLIQDMAHSLSEEKGLDPEFYGTEFKDYDKLAEHVDEGVRKNTAALKHIANHHNLAQLHRRSEKGGGILDTVAKGAKAAVNGLVKGAKMVGSKLAQGATWLAEHPDIVKSGIETVQTAMELTKAFKQSDDPVNLALEGAKKKTDQMSAFLDDDTSDEDEQEQEASGGGNLFVQPTIYI